MPTLSRLAIDGGTPIRSTLLPYGRQCVDDDDVAAVVEVLRSNWLTTGPNVPAFEEAFARYCGSQEAIAMSSGTAALHAIASAAGIGPGDQVIVPTMTFAATSNCVIYVGAEPVFCDVEQDTLLIDVNQAERLITPRTKAIIAVDYAGQPCDYERIYWLAEKHGLTVVSDACHALGASYRGRQIGGVAVMTAFSLHPVKHITTGEGGVVTTNDSTLADHLRRFRNHGITTDHQQRETSGSWFYEMVTLGYNYRITDFQCALGRSQLQKLPVWLERRRALARRYSDALEQIPAFQPLEVSPNVEHAYHLYVVRIDRRFIRVDRNQVYQALRREGIGVNVHYIPVHLHPYYRDRMGTTVGQCPQAEAAYEDILSLPMFSAMLDDDIDDVIAALQKVAEAYAT